MEETAVWVRGAPEVEEEEEEEEGEEEEEEEEDQEASLTVQNK